MEDEEPGLGSLLDANIYEITEITEKSTEDYHFRFKLHTPICQFDSNLKCKGITILDVIQPFMGNSTKHQCCL